MSFTSHGFTLLELLVVLAIMALVAGMVMPDSGKVFARFQARLQRDNVLEQIADLGIEARRRASGFTIDNYPPKDKDIPLQLPDGWSLQTTAPIHYRANGFCDGGTIVLSTAPGIQFTIKLQKPYCQPLL